MVRRQTRRTRLADVARLAGVFRLHLFAARLRSGAVGCRLSVVKAAKQKGPLADDLEAIRFQADGRGDLSPWTFERTSAKVLLALMDGRTVSIPISSGAHLGRARTRRPSITWTTS
jgi:hypothetical protein